MGRDRYAEYSAQRLARSSVGQTTARASPAGNDASDEEQVNAILDNQWANICASLGLPAVADGMRSRRGSPHRAAGDQVAAQARGVVNSCVRPMIDQTPGQRRAVGRAGRPGARRSGTASPRAPMPPLITTRSGGTSTSSRTWSRPPRVRWPRRACRMRRACQAGRPTARRRADAGVCRPVEVRSRRHRRPARRDEGDAGVTSAPSPTRGRSPTRCSPVRRAPSSGRSMRHWPTMSPTPCGAMVTEVFDPLIDASTRRRRCCGRPPGPIGSRSVWHSCKPTSTRPGWLTPTNSSPIEFSEADNEVMLTRSADFKQRYEIDLPAAVGRPAAIPACWARGSAGRRACGHRLLDHPGRQQVAGRGAAGRRTHDDLDPRAFLRHPETGDGLIAQAPPTTSTCARPSC